MNEDKEFEAVELSFRGKTKLTITGEYFQLPGWDLAFAKWESGGKLGQAVPGGVMTERVDVLEAADQATVDSPHRRRRAGKRYIMEG